MFIKLGAQNHLSEMTFWTLEFQLEISNIHTPYSTARPMYMSVWLVDSIHTLHTYPVWLADSIHKLHTYPASRNLCIIIGNGNWPKLSSVNDLTWFLTATLHSCCKEAGCCIYACQHLHMESKVSFSSISPSVWCSAESPLQISLSAKGADLEQPSSIRVLLISSDSLYGWHR